MTDVERDPLLVADSEVYAGELRLIIGGASTEDGQSAEFEDQPPAQLTLVQTDVAHKPKKVRSTGLPKSTNAGFDNSPPDGLTIYLNQIGGHEILSPADEIELGAKLIAGREAAAKLADTDIALNSSERRLLKKQLEEAEVAKQRIYACNYKLVVAWARRYRNSPLDLADRIQEGNMGMMHAVEKFDSRKGFKFSTYASTWIRQAIQRAGYSAGPGIRWPSDVHQDFAAYNSTLEMLEGSGIDPRDLTDEELSELADTSVERIRLFRTRGGTDHELLSLDAQLNEDSDRTLTDKVGHVDEIDTSAEQLNSLLQVIKPVITNEKLIIYKSVLARELGLTDETNEQIATRLGVKVGIVNGVPPEVRDWLRHPLLGLTIGPLGASEWRKKAACKGAPYELFFPGRGRNTVVNMAKSICADCVVLADCREATLQLKPRKGVWAGTTERSRRADRKAVGSVVS